jgi:hypothetical protein
MNKATNKNLQNVEESLVNIVKINKNADFCFESILTYIDIIKEYKTNNKPYRCEWLDPLVLDEVITNDTKPNEDLLPNQKIGNVVTFNPIKVQKVI